MQSLNHSNAVFWKIIKWLACLIGLFIIKSLKHQKPPLVVLRVHLNYSLILLSHPSSLVHLHLCWQMYQWFLWLSRCCEGFCGGNAELFDEKTQHAHVSAKCGGTWEHWQLPHSHPHASLFLDHHRLNHCMIPYFRNLKLFECQNVFKCDNWTACYVSLVC